MKILLTEKFPEIKQEYLNYLEKNNKILSPHSVSPKGREAEQIEVVIFRSNTEINSELLDNYPNLKFVARV